MSISQEDNNQAVKKTWLRSMGLMLWRDTSLLLMGALLHFYLLYPVSKNQQNDFLQEFLPWSLTVLFWFYIGLIGLYYILPWIIRYWKDSREESQPNLTTQVQWMHWAQPRMLASGAIALIPIPNYLLALPFQPGIGILGIVIALVIAWGLMSSGARTMDSKELFSRHSLRNLKQSNTVVTSSDRQALLLGIGGLLVLLYMQASIPNDAAMRTLRHSYCGLLVLFSITCEIRQLNYERILKLWKKQHGTLKETPPWGCHIFNAYTLLFWNLILFSLLIFPDVTMAQWGGILLLLRQVWCFFWFHFENQRRQIRLPLQDQVAFSSRIITETFLGLILFGGVLLSLPQFSATGESIGILNALFSATSATCVTGLNVLNPATDLNAQGQFVLILLAQLGGLGILTISYFIAHLILKNMGIRGNAAIEEMTGEQRAQEARTLLKITVIGTFVIEGIGALILAWYYHTRYSYQDTAGMLHTGLPWLKSIGYAAFMSISAFCNAGLSIHEGNMANFISEPIPVWTISALIMLGGLSFLVLYTVWQKIRHPHLQHHWGAHTRLVILMTFSIWIIGAILFFLLERRASLNDLNLRDALRNAWFHTISSRTAGFNTVNPAAMTQPSKLLMMIMMFIGTAPGSTGGGIKVTALGIFLLLCRTWFTGAREITFYGRKIPSHLIILAGSCTILMLLLTLSGAFLLSITMPERPLTDLSFEAVSAAATAGLSLDVTPHLPTAGKWIVMTLMFLGRIGPLALLLSFTPKRKNKFTAPDANILIG